ncbi:MAG: hypothetical protein RIQ52_1485 [Pseudomonadota bacterium]|jgi:ADP-ribose pyrophosphatase YjhB (NUDIX family)
MQPLFCTQCAAPLLRAIPEDDEHERDLCGGCGTVHYQNPKIIAGCIPVWEDRILLCRRAIEPRRGYWTLPAGFMEMNETLEEAAGREAREEAMADVEIGQLYTMFSLAHISQVHVFFRGTLKQPVYAPGRESLEVSLFGMHEIPWEELSFTSVRMTLQLLQQDQSDGNTFLPRSIALPTPGATSGIRYA